MTPKVDPLRTPWGRWWVFLTSVALWSLTLLSAFAPQPALALNGDSRTLFCQSCYSSTDFVTAGVAEANRNVLPGLYVVVSQTYARTGLIRVTGEVPACGRSCGQGLLNVSGAAMEPDGSALGSDADLGTIDAAFFAVDRGFPMSVTIPVGCGAQQSDCGNSLATSTDAGIAYVIGEALQAAGYTQSTVPDVVSIIVVFQNGDKALYQHIPGQDIYSWKFSGYAWNAAGTPINRNGTTKSNPNTAGTGGGGGTGGSGSFVYGFSEYSDCVWQVSIDVPNLGGVSGGTVSVVGFTAEAYTPC
jgi:uncharacterized membrane protein YgcG